MLLAACGEGSGDHDDDADHASSEGDGMETPSGAECPPGSTLTYETFGKAFMDDYCVRCHSTELEGTARSGAPEGHDFDMLAGILLVAEHIDEYAAAGPDAVNTKMPPTEPRPTEEQRMLLGEWLACELGGDAGTP
jgi:hypothetical protein